LEARQKLALAQGRTSQEDDGTPPKVAPPHEVGTHQANEIHKEVGHHEESAPQEDGGPPEEVEASREIGPHDEVAVSREVEACGEKLAPQRMGLQVEAVEEEAHVPPRAMDEKVSGYEEVSRRSRKGMAQ
jgi:hypothetical protein